MHSKNGVGVQAVSRPSFIEAARRGQIVGAAIETLAELGYGRASFAQIAKRAQIAPSLISYHFTDKDALVAQTLESISTAWDQYVRDAVAASATPDDQLRAYIVASLTYLGTRPAHFAALVEIVFNARTPEGVLLYRSDADDPGLTLLKVVLTQGQQAGTFRAFDVHSMAIAIRGAIAEFFGDMHRADSDLERYTAEVVELFSRATIAMRS